MRRVQPIFLALVIAVSSLASASTLTFPSSSGTFTENSHSWSVTGTGYVWNTDYRSAPYCALSNSSNGDIIITKTAGAPFQLNSLYMKGDTWASLSIKGYNGGSELYSTGSFSPSGSYSQRTFSSWTGINKIVIQVSGNGFFAVDDIDYTVANLAPTDITLSSSTVANGAASGTTVGSFTTTDAEDAGGHTYTFAAGGTDNASFTISGSDLLTAFTADHATKSSYSVKIRSTDSGSLYYEKTFTINVMAPATVWNGPKLTFTKGDGTDESLEANQDRITDTLWLTRGSSGGLLNYTAETSYDYDYTLPSNTEWADGTTASYGSLSYSSWYDWHGGDPSSKIGVNAVLRVVDENIYIDIKMLSWTSGGGGGFSYERSTPPGSNAAPEITQGAGPLSVTMSEDGSPTAWSAPTLSATDGDGDTLTWSVSSVASHGTATVSGTGSSPSTFNYAPALNWSGSDSFTVQVSDSTDTDTIVVDVTVTAVNDAPSVATNAGAGVNEGQSVTITNSMLNEGDPDDSGTGLTYTVTSGPTNGAVQLSGSNTSSFTQDDIDNSRVTYLHDGSETTTDSFGFSLADGGENGVSAATGTFSLTVSLLNDAPSVATNTGAGVNEGQSVTITNSMLNEGDPDDSGTGLTYTITSGPTNGAVRLSGSNTSSFTQDDIDNSRVTYLHDGSETTMDSFGFSLADGGEDGVSAATGTFGLTVSLLNDAPSVATNTGAGVNEGQSVTITNSMLNEGDPDDSGTGLMYTVTSGPSNGAVQLSGSNTTSFTQDDIDNSRVTYLHDGSETTTDSFGFSLADGGENGATAATGTFNLTVNPVNDPPVLTLSGTSATYTEDGSAVVIDGSLTITDPDGSTDTLDGASVMLTDGFVSSEDVLAATDAHGITSSYDSGTGVLTLTGTATVAEYQEVLRSATYANGNTLNPNLTNRSVVFQLGDALYYAANGHFYAFVSSPSISWTAAETAAANLHYMGLQGYLVTVTSSGENDFSVGKIAGEGWIGANDAAVEGEWRWVTGPEGLENSGDGRYFFHQTSSQYGTSYAGSTPGGGDAVGGYYSNWYAGEPNDAGDNEDYAHYRTDGTWNDYDVSNAGVAGYVVEYGGMPGDPALQISGTATVTITGTNDVPTIDQGITTSVTVAEDSGLTDLRSYVSATDPDGDTLTWQLTASPSHGTATVSGTGTSPATFNYTPDTDYNGPDSLTIQVNDPDGTTDSITVNITVTPVSDPPSTAQLDGPDTLMKDAIGYFTVTSYETTGEVSNATQDTIFDLSSDTSGTGTFYSDAAGTTPITQVTISNGSSSAAFYYRDDTYGFPIITAAQSSGMSLGNASLQMAIRGNHALDFDGTDDYVVTSGGPDLATGQTFTFECWARRDSAGSSDLMIGQGNTNYAKKCAYMGLGAGDVFYVAFIDSGSLVASSETYTDTGWHHYAVTYDNQTVTGYRDGVEVFSDTISAPYAPQSNRLSIGIAPWNLSTYPFGGSIDEVRVWDDVRTQSEIRGNMHRQLTGGEANLAAYYKMDVGTGTTLHDASANGNDGALTNGPAWQTSGAMAGPDNCLYFDGVNDHMTAPSPWSTLDDSSVISVEAWVQPLYDVTPEWAWEIACISDTSGGDGDGATDYFGFRIDKDTGRLQIGIDNGTAWTDVKSDDAVPESDWSHVAFTMDAGMSVTFYINGVASGGGTLAPRIVDGIDNITVGAFHAVVGGGETDKYTDYFKGSIDEVRAWNGVRTAEQIQDNMCRMLTGYEPGLAGYYRFGQQPVALQLMAYDWSSNAQNGVLALGMDTTSWVSSSAFNTWIGSDSTAWSTAANWGACAVPGMYDNVGVPDYTSMVAWPAGNHPTISGSPTIGSLMLASGADIGVASDLTVNGNIILNADVNVGGYTVQAGGTTVNNAELSIGSGTYDANGDFDSSGGSVTNTSSGNLYLAGAADLGSFSPGTGTVTWDGSSNQSINSSGTLYFHNLTINSGGHVDASSGRIDVSNQFTVQSGDFITGLFNAFHHVDIGIGASLSLGWDMTITGNWSNSGILNHNGNAVILNGADQIISGATAFYDLTKTVSSTDTLYFADGETQTVANTLTLQGVSGALLALDSRFGSPWNIDAQGARTLEYLDVQNSNGANATPIDVRGANCTDSGGNANWWFTNQAPVITQGASVSVTMSEDGSPTAWSAPTLGATDTESDPLTWSLASAASHGTATVSGTGASPATLAYAPAADFNGSDSFDVQVSDDRGDVDTITVNVTVEPVNDAPVIDQGESASVTMSEDGSPTAFSLTLTAQDTESDSLSWSVSGAASNGTASVADGVVSYTPDSDYNGLDSFDVQVSDGNGGTDTITLSVTVEAVNDAPVIDQGESVSVTMSEDSAPTAFSLTLTAQDTESDTLNWGISSAAGNGSALVADGVVSYTPTADFNGSDSFDVQVSDGNGGADTITVNVTVEPVNDVPLIDQGDSVSVTMSEDGSPTAWSAPAVTVTDPDLGDAHTWSLSSAASNGTATVSGTGASPGILNYMPASNWNGSDSFAVQVDDGNGGTDTITVDVTVEAVNDAPEIDQGESISVTMSEDGFPTAFNLTLTAQDAESDALAWSIESAALHGTASVADGVVSHAPDEDFNGSDSFVVQVSDGNGGTDTITVNVTVVPVNDAPLIDQGDSVSVIMSEDGSPTAWSAPTLTAADPDTGDTLTWSVSGAASHGTATVSGTGTSPATFTYASDADYAGSDSFVVQVSDGNGGTDIITVNVTVEAVNDAPVIDQGDSVSVTMSEDGSPTAWSPPTLTITDPDADDASAAVWSVSSPATYGAAVVSGTGVSPETFTYTPESDWHGTDSFVVQVDDGNGGTDTVTVNVTVEPVNDAPVLDQGDSVSVTMSEDGSPTAWSPPTLTITDSDAGDASATVWSVSSPASHGTAVVSGTGVSPETFTYTPELDWSGTDSFVVQTDDGNGGTATVTVNVTVEAVNDAPVIDQGDGPLAVTMSEDGAPTAWTAPALSASDVDAGGTLTWSVATPAENGTATVSGDGDAPAAFDYVPSADFNGADSFVVAVSDGALTDSITVNVTVEAVNDRPVITQNGVPVEGALPVSMDEDGAFTPPANLAVNDPDTGDAFTWSVSTAAANGTATVSGTGDAPVMDYVPGADFNGTDSFGFTVSDGELSAEPVTIEITVTATNDDPVIAQGANTSVVMSEDGSPTAFALTLDGSDVDSETLTWSISRPASEGTANVEGENGTATVGYLPPADWNGVDDFQVLLEDGEGGEARIEVEVTVDPVNDAPVLDSIGPQAVAEAALLTFTVAASDIEDDGLTFGAGNLPEGAAFDPETATFSWTPTFEDAGVHRDIVFTVTDDGTPPQGDAETITITVGDVNRPPVLDPIGDKTVVEDEVLTFTVTASDPDGDALTLSATGLPTGAAFDPATGVFTWQPGFDDNGLYENVQFAVADDGTPVESDAETITITVGDVNRPPVLNPIGDRSVDEGGSLSFTVSGSDPDGDHLVFAADTLPDGASFEPGTQQFTYSPGFDDAGVKEAIFSVSDGDLEDSEAIAVTVNDVNRAPVLDAVGDRTVAEGQTLSFSVTATDGDGDALTFGAEGLPEGATFNPATGAFAYTPGYEAAGVYAVTFSATDGELGDEVTVTITVTDTNRAPVLAVVGSQNLAEGQTLAFSLQATDPDDDALTFDAQGLPAGATLDNNTGAFSYSPAFDDAGQYEVTFSVSDGVLSDEETVTLTVANTNRAPVLAAIGDRSVDEGATLSFLVEATDPDGDAVVSGAQGLPAGATLDTDTGAFSYSPGFDDAGQYLVTFLVSDGALSDEETITLTVTNTNRPPVLAAIGDRSVDEGATLSFSVEATDPDGDELTFSATGLPEGATFEEGLFAFAPDFDAAGDYSVQFSVSDGDLGASETVTITVLNVNRAPVLAAIGDRAVDEGDTLSFALSATDPDGDTLTFSGTNLPAGASLNPASGAFSWTPGDDAAGDYAMTFSVSDDGAPNLGDSETITVTVNDVAVEDQTPIILTGPTVDGITPNTAYVEWTTDLRTTGELRYGLSQDVLDQVVTSSETGTRHRVQLTGLEASTRYHLRAAVTGSAESGTVSSHLVSFTTLTAPDTTAPQWVLLPVVMGLTDAELIVGWTTDEPATAIVTCEDGVNAPVVVAASELNNTHAVTVSGLNPETEYTVTILVADQQGNDNTTVLTVTTLATPDTAAPRVIEGPVKESSSANTVIIRWTTDEPADSALRFFTGEEPEQRRSLDGFRTQHRVTVGSLEPGTEYFFQAESSDWLGNGPAFTEWLSVKTRTTPDTTPPVFTDGPRVIGRTNGTATIYWETDEPSDTVVEYGLTEALGQRRSDSAKTLEHTVTLLGLTPDATYYFTCSSTDSATPGNTAYADAMESPGVPLRFSVTTNAFPDVTAPLITAGPSLAWVTDTAASVAWTTDEIGDSYVFYRRASSSQWRTVGSARYVTEHLVTLSQLAPETDYVFIVSTSDVAGNPPVESEEFTFTTGAGPDETAPVLLTGPEVSDLTVNSARINWTTDEYASGEVSFGSTPDDLSEVAPTNVLSPAQTVRLTNLAPGTTYHYLVRSVDQAQNATSSTVAVFTTPKEGGNDGAVLTLLGLLLFFLAESDGGGGNGGPCFIATAAYGTPLAGEIDTLREFRDRILLTSPVGTALVDLYYRCSPPLAAAVAASPALAAITRALLLPVLLAAHVALALPSHLVWLMALLAGLSALARASRRRRQPAPAADIDHRENR